MSTVDRFQFDPRMRKIGTFKKAAQANLSGDDLANSMHLGWAPGRTRRWIPQFANNDAQLRSVIAHTTISYVFHSKQVPPGIEIDLANLKRLADSRQAHWQSLADGSANRYWEAVASHLRSVADAGGYMELIAAVSYRAWRLRWHDKDCASQMGLKAHTTRDILGRLVQMADRLGYTTYEPRSDARMRVTPETVAMMWENGAPVGDIAAILSCHPTLVRHHLRKLGLHVWAKGRGRRAKGTSCRKCGTPYDTDSRGQQMCPECTRRRLRAWHSKRSEQAFLKTVAWG
jgi:hypothetical protein